MKIRNVFVAMVAVAIAGLSASEALAQSSGSLANNLFSQYYTQPGASMVQAGMYPAPHPVPSWTGHTYYTYQPLMPHEMMYAHSRNYYNYYAGAGQFYCDECAGRFHRGGSGLNKTTVVWQSGCNHMAPLPFSLEKFQALHYRLASRKYCLDNNCRRIHGIGLGRRAGCYGGDCYGGETCDGGYCDGGYDAYSDYSCESCASNSARQNYRR